MSGAWDDSDDDDWDKSDDDLDARFDDIKINNKTLAPVFDDEEDLAVIEKERNEKFRQAELKKKGNALAAKKKAEDDRKEEEELARKAMELEAEMESKMTPQELREQEIKRAEEADSGLIDDLFGMPEKTSREIGVGGKVMDAGESVKMVDLKDHLKHARKVSQCLKGHGKVHLATAFLKEIIQESKSVLDEDSVADIIKVCNVIKNELVTAAKTKKKGQAQKSKKNKQEEKKAKKLAEELYGKNDEYDEYDDFGATYEDDFF